MTFLNPAALLGLAAAAIPILLHLLNLRKLRTVEFSTLAFLKEIEKTKMRWLKLRQILLLLVRTALIVFIVLAFARPALRGSALGGIGTHAKTTVALLLDDSFSMLASDEHGSLFSQAKAAALNVFSVLKEGDEIILQKFSEGNPSGTLETPTHNFAAVKSAIEETKVSTSYRPVGDMLQRASVALKGSTNFNKEVYLITDLQKTNFATGEKGTPLSSGGKASLFDRYTKLFLIPIGAKDAENVCVDSVEIKTKIFEKERPISLEVRLRNYGSAPLLNYIASLYFDGARVMQKSVDLPPDGAVSVAFSAVPKRAGFISGYIGTEPDEIDLDNQRFFTVFIPEKVSILFVTESARDITFLNLALTADERSRTFFSIQTIEPSKLLRTPLSRFDVLIFSNVSSFTPDQAERLRQYAAEGGGILLFPGQKIQLKNYNEVLCRALQIPPFAEKITGEPDQAAFLTFENVDFDHPLFIGMFEESARTRKGKRQSIESPQIKTALEYRPGAGGQSVIQLSNGASFLAEYRIERGRILVFSVSATPDWSNFPLKGIFAPLIRRSVSYLSSGVQEPNQYHAGIPTFVTLPAKRMDKSSTVGILHRTPDGEEEILQPLSSEGKIRERKIIVYRTNTPGIHEIFQGNELLSSFAVNVDPRESDLRKLSLEEAKKWLTAQGINREAIHVLLPNEPFENRILQSRFGVELWKYLLFLALICAILEMIIGRGKAERSRSPNA